VCVFVHVTWPNYNYNSYLTEDVSHSSTAVVLDTLHDKVNRKVLSCACTVLLTVTTLLTAINHHLTTSFAG